MAAPHRSGSEKRRATAQIWARCTPEQKAAIELIAQRSGFESPGALFLHTLLNIPMPRATRRPKIEVEAIVRLLGELGKIGSNVNQIAHGINIWQNGGGRAPDRYLERLDETLRDFAELRLACLQALGRERDHKRHDDPDDADHT